MSSASTVRPLVSSAPTRVFFHRAPDANGQRPPPEMYYEGDPRIHDLFVPARRDVHADGSALRAMSIPCSPSTLPPTPVSATTLPPRSYSFTSAPLGSSYGYAATAMPTQMIVSNRTLSRSQSWTAQSSQSQPLPRPPSQSQPRPPHAVMALHDPHAPPPHEWARQLLMNPLPPKVHLWSATTAAHKTRGFREFGANDNIEAEEPAGDGGLCGIQCCSNTGPSANAKLVKKDPCKREKLRKA